MDGDGCVIKELGVWDGNSGDRRLRIAITNDGRPGYRKYSDVSNSQAIESGALL
jgi:hypothetical protein